MARIAFVDVMRLDGGQLASALHLPRQRLELRIVRNRYAHGPPAFTMSVVTAWCVLLQLQLYLHAQGRGNIGPSSHSFFKNYPLNATL